MAIFKRTWRLSIQIGKQLKTYQELEADEVSLKIEFDVTTMVEGAMPTGSITVYGLPDKDMEVLASGYNPSKGVFKQNFVSLEVGYLQTGLSTLFSGNLVDIDPNFSTLGNSITFRLQNGIQNNLARNSVQTSLQNKVDFKAVCAECAKNNGLSLNYAKDITKRFVTDYSFAGTPFQQIASLRKFYSDVDIFIDGTKQVLNVLPKAGKPFNPVVLSNKTGMLSKPKPTAQGVQVLSLLNTNFKAGGFVKLQNEILSSFDGEYRIFELKHTGSNRGQNWTSQLTLQRL